jgi:hypothetical protein
MYNPMVRFAMEDELSQLSRMRQDMYNLNPLAKGSLWAMGLASILPHIPNLIGGHTVGSEKKAAFNNIMQGIMGTAGHGLQLGMQHQQNQIQSREAMTHLMANILGASRAQYIQPQLYQENKPGILPALAGMATAVAPFFMKPAGGGYSLP